MDLVVDANVLFAALIKDSETARLLFAKELHLFAPEFLLVEVAKHRDEIARKTRRPGEQVWRFLDIVSRRIAIVPEEDWKRFEAEATVISPDPGDISYLALALHLRCPVWSNDARLKGQKRVEILSTREIIELLDFVR